MAKPSAVLDALFPSIRRKVLAAVLQAPEKWWSLSELARSLKTTPSSLQRELPALAKAGILQRCKGKYKRTLFRAKRNSPIFGDLQGLFEKVVRQPESDSSKGGANPTPLKISQALLSRFDREVLYARVWSEPILDIARDYRISDVRLAKICRKLLIPLPGRGYWAKKRAGKSVAGKPSLPPI